MKKQENEVLDRRFVAGEGISMRTAETIHRKLTEAFAPSELTVEDDSARHEGHTGHRHGGETHFNVRIVSAAFTGLSRVERQRRVYAALAEELRGQVHALSLTCLANSEIANSE